MNSDRLLRQTERILLRDGNLCHYCEEKMLPRAMDNNKSVSREHIVPQAWGGPNDDNNIVLAHRDCNNARGCVMNYCGCDFCVRATEKFWYSKGFQKLLELGKPKVFKKHGKWFVILGGKMFAESTFEEAHSKLFIRKYYV